MTRPLQRAAVASAPEVEAVAEDLLRKGNAVDAVVAGVFAACAISPGVLLGPIQILVGGGGSGLRALDGRVRQPGIGAPRPRGFRDTEEVPDAARVGVPWLPATLSAAVAASGTVTFAQVLGPALAMAKGSPRHEVLQKIAQRGPRALEERPLSSELLVLAGRTAEGLLTSDDLSSPRPEIHPASRHSLRRSPREPNHVEVDRSRVLIALPWAHHEEGIPVAPASPPPIATTRAVAAVDRHGSFAIACWDEGVDGLLIGELGLRAPFFAVPVMRGETRIRPGEARPAAAPIALIGADAAPEFALAAFGAGDAYDVLRGAVRSIAAEDRIEAHGEARLVALSYAMGGVSAFR